MVSMSPHAAQAAPASGFGHGSMTRLKQLLPAEHIPLDPHPMSERA
jgi:hypothetical protein